MLRDALRLVVMAFVQVDMERHDSLSGIGDMVGLLQSQLADSPELLAACVGGIESARSTAPEPQAPANPADSAQKMPPGWATSGELAPPPFRIKGLPDEWQPSETSVASARLQAKAFLGISSVVSAGTSIDAVQASTKDWCTRNYPSGMEPKDIESVFSGFALARESDVHGEKTAAGVKGLIDALGGADMNRGNADCLVDLLHSRRLTPEARKQVVGYLGQVTGKSPDGSRTELHKAIQGDPAGFGKGGLYRPGWLGDWPRGEMARLFQHYHTCAQMSYVSARKVEKAHLEGPAPLAKATAQPATPEVVPRAWAPYNLGPLVPKPEFQPGPKPLETSNADTVRRLLQVQPDPQVRGRSPANSAPAVLPPTLDHNPDYDF